MKITVIGLGYVGLPVAIKLAEAGHHVIGYDQSKQRIEAIRNGVFNCQEANLYERLKKVGKKLFLTPTFSASDVYVITVQTPVDENGKADVSHVEKALTLVAHAMKKNDLVILESTVPPWSNQTFQILLSEQSGLKNEEFSYAYCPETIQPGNVFFELENNPRVIGVFSDESFQLAKEIYSSVTVGAISQSTFLIAEHVKILQNAYRDFEIAFSNALSIYCDEHGMDSVELIKLMNQHPRIKVLSPGVGVGGHCLPVDPLFIIEKARFEPISFSRRINDEKTQYVFKKILKTNIRDVVIFGASYKPNSDDTRNSPCILIALQLKIAGVDVSFCEPNIKTADINGIPNIDIHIATQLKGLFVIAQKHQCFIDNVVLFKGKTILDFVGLV